MSDQARPFPDIPGVRFGTIPGFDRYAASDDGAIWTINYRGSQNSAAGWRRLKPQTNLQGYLWVCLQVRQKLHHRAVHQLILETFVGPCPPGMETCHGPDNSKTNNSLKNLRWDTKAANELDKRTNGTLVFGTRVYGAKLDESKVSEIIRLSSTISGASLAEMFGVTPTQICRILKGKVWKHVARNASA